MGRLNLIAFLVFAMVVSCCQAGEVGLSNPSFEDNFSDAGGWLAGVPSGWVEVAAGSSVGVIGEQRTSTPDTPYGIAWMQLGGKGAAVATRIGDLGLYGKFLDLSFIVSRRTNQPLNISCGIEIVAGSVTEPDTNFVLAEYLYDDNLQAANTYNEVRVQLRPEGDSGSYDYLWLVVENDTDNLSSSWTSQLQFDMFRVSCSVVGKAESMVPLPLQRWVQIDAAPTLCWQPGNDPNNIIQGYKVYLGDNGSVNNIVNGFYTTDTQYQYSGLLSYNTNYQWRIDEFLGGDVNNPENYVKGDVWEFSTEVQTCLDRPSMDFNGDCVVDLADFAQFAAQWLSGGCGKSHIKYLMDMVYNNPGEAKTISKYNDPSYIKGLNYNGQVPHLYVQCAVTYDSFDPNVIPPGSPDREWIESQAAQIDQYLVKARAAGIKVYPFTDILVIPKLLKQKYATKLGDLNIQRPMVQAVVRVQLNEIFDRFPELDGLVIRFGETYLTDTPYHTGASPVSSDADHIKLLQILRDEVCVKRNKKIFYRTWGNLHTNVSRYLHVTNAIEPHPNLIFSIKHTAGDFHRTLKFNPTIMIGKHPQIIEVQCQREDEGKGAHPNYIAKGVIDGFEEYKYSMGDGQNKCLRDIVNDSRFAGVWTWSRGGGWQGPYIKNELWVDLNVFVISRWVSNPDRTEEDIFNEFMDMLGLKGRNRDMFREIALLSAEGVLRGHESLWTNVNVWWTRDWFLGGMNQLRGTFDNIINAGLVEQVLREKAESVAIWKRIEDLAKQIQVDDTVLKHYIVTSCTYGRIKYEIIEKGWTVMLLGRLGDRNGGQYDVARMSAAISDYDKLWQEWQDLKADNSDCASIYKNYYGSYHVNNIPPVTAVPGMQDTVDHYRSIIGQ